MNDLNALQTKYNLVKTQLEQAQTNQVRLETQLEQAEKQLDELNTELLSNFGTNDVEQLQAMVIEAESEINKLLEQASKILG